jgi:hypothetical protein
MVGNKSDLLFEKINQNEVKLMPAISPQLLNSIFVSIQKRLATFKETKTTAIQGQQSKSLIFATELFNAVGGNYSLSRPDDRYSNQNVTLLKNENFTVDNDTNFPLGSIPDTDKKYPSADTAAINAQATKLLALATKFYIDNLSNPPLSSSKAQDEALKTFIKEITRDADVSNASLATWKSLMSSMQDAVANTTVEQAFNYLGAAVIKLDEKIKNAAHQQRTEQIQEQRRWLDEEKKHKDGASPTGTTPVIPSGVKAKIARINAAAGGNDTSKGKPKGAEAKRKEQEAEAKRKNEEAEAKRKEQEAEAKRKNEEAEAKRKEQEAEAKRKNEEAEAKRKEQEAEAKRKDEEAEAKRKEEEKDKPKPKTEAERLAEEAEAARRAAEAEAARRAAAEEARRRAAEEAAAKAAAKDAERRANPQMKQQEVLTPTSVPKVSISNFYQLEELVQLTKQTNDSKQLKQISDLLYRFGLKNVQSDDPNQRNLETRAQLLKEWNTILLPLQSELIDRIATLTILHQALTNAKSLLNGPKPADDDISNSDWKARQKEQDVLIAQTQTSLDTYNSILNKVNEIETGLAQASTTVHNDPDYENQILVKGTVIEKIDLSTGDKEKALKDLREKLGKVVTDRSEAVALELVSQHKVDLELARAKIDTTKEYTLVGFVGTDNNKVNEAHGSITTMRAQPLNLNTIYSMAATKDDRRNFTLQVVEMRQDLNVAMLLTKFAIDGHAQFGDLLPYFKNLTTDQAQLGNEIHKLFSSLSSSLPSKKEIETLLATRTEFGPNSGAVADAMHKELTRVLRHEKNPNVPGVEAMRLAKEAVERFIDATGGQERIVIRGNNEEMKRAVKYYCELMKQLAKTPEEKAKYEYRDPNDSSKPTIERGLWDKIAGNWGNKNKEENEVVAGLNKDMRRVAKTLLREENELDSAVPLKNSFAVELAVKSLGHTEKKHNLAALTSSLLETNTLAAKNALVKDAIEAAKTNLRSEDRLPAAFTKPTPRPAPAA